MKLGLRKDKILEAVVDGYVGSGEPIGSAWLAANFDFGCRPATLRNEMAELSEHGYLMQPHTSAGRVPSRQGYRYYVDELVPQRDLPSACQVDPLSAYRGDGIEVDDIVQQTCKLLADMTQCAGVASPPARSAASFHRVYVTAASERHVLLVVLLSTGHVEHRLLDSDDVPTAAGLQAIANYLNARFSGMELSEVALSSLGEAPAELGPHATLLERAFRSASELAEALSEGRIFLEGTGHILRQREFHNVLRLEQLLLALEERSALFGVFSAALLSDGLMVLIGVDGPVEAMRECSVIASPYVVGSRLSGFIGVLGPTRMDYSRNMAYVGQMARSLSAVLTHVSLS